MTLNNSPIPFADEHGTPCFRIPLGNRPGTFAIVDQQQFANLVSQGVTGRWFLNSNGTGRSYVRIAVPVEGRRGGTNLLVARLIIGAGPRTVVRYANGNPLDLRFVNLAWRKGKSGRTDADTLAAAVRLRADRSAKMMRSSAPERNARANV